MRSFVDAQLRFLGLGLAGIALAGCGLIGGGNRPQSMALAAESSVQAGPAADYPMVLGEPFTVEGALYTPADTLNYDMVGYAAVDQGTGVTAAHRTLPLPSYAEVTSLETGKTILVRVERRGPMAGSDLVALSPAALAQLGSGESVPVRLRRVNPPEVHRAELRAGRPAPERIDTPKGLVEVLRRKLPVHGAANLRGAASPPPAALIGKQQATRADLPAVARVPIAASPADKAAVAYPLPSLSGAVPAARPVVVAQASPAPDAYRLPNASTFAQTTAAKPAVQERSAPVAPGTFVIQAGTFASQANAERAAKALGGFLSPSGKLYRVRTGPFTSRGQAEAALAKVRAAGYSDARVTTAG